MKKILFAAFVVVAASFASCDNTAKTTETTTTDSTTVDTTVVVDSVAVDSVVAE